MYLLNAIVLIENEMRRNMFKGLSDTWPFKTISSLILLISFGQIICSKLSYSILPLYMQDCIKYNSGSHRMKIINACNVSFVV